MFLLRYAAFLYITISGVYVTLGYISSILPLCSQLFGSRHSVARTFTWDTDAVVSISSGHALDHDLVMSKAFEYALKPTKIIPYYYRALHQHDRDDITITTLVTSNRFERLKQLVEMYQGTDEFPSPIILELTGPSAGPVSVTVHITSAPLSHQTSLVEKLHTLYTSSPLFPRWVDVHLVTDTHDRQFNLWRNVARLYARTSWIMMLDVDFVICTDVRKRFGQALLEGGQDAGVRALARSGRAAFVIPAFEYVVQEEGKDWRVFPRDKQGLMELVNAGRIGMFHQSWAPGHNSTAYDQYYAAKPGEVYRIDAYQKSYEPYVIMQRAGPPWCDERFVGYGGNKAACLFSLYISGIDFYVLPDDFLIHQSHEYAEQTRKEERKHNRQVYDDYRKQVCLEQILQNLHEDTLYADAKSNLREECLKTPGVPEFVLEVSFTLGARLSVDNEAADLESNIKQGRTLSIKCRLIVREMNILQSVLLLRMSDL